MEDSIRSSIAIKIKLEKLMKALIEEEKKEAEQGGDDNGGTDVEDSAMMSKLMKRKKLKEKSMLLLTQIVRKISDCSFVFFIWFCCMVSDQDFIHP